MRRVILFLLLATVLVSGCFEKTPVGFSTDQPVRVGHQRLAIGRHASVGVKDDGTVWSWGVSDSGSLGQGGSFVSLAPRKLQGLAGIVEVSGQNSHFLALSSGGDVYSWGDNHRGQLGYVTRYDFQTVPQQIEGLKNIISVSAGFEHSVALDRDGTVWGLGSGDNSALAGKSSLVPNGQTESVQPVKLGTIPGAVRVIAGTSMNAVLTKDGQVWVMGHNGEGELGCAINETRLTEFTHCQGIVASDVATGLATLFILDRRGFVWASGMNFEGQLGRGSTDHERHTSLEKVHRLGKVIGVASNGSGVCALDADGQIWVWGAGVTGPTRPAGLGFVGIVPGSLDTPYNIAKLPGAFEIFGGPATNAVALKDGSVRFFGSVEDGIFGMPASALVTVNPWLTPQESAWTWKEK